MLNHFRFAEPYMIWMMLLTPLILGTGLFYRVRCQQKLTAWMDTPFQNRLVTGRKALWFWIKLSILMLATALSVAALMRPQGSPVAETVKKQGRDLIFLLDVSTSMQAEDLRPNRLERAKELIRDVITQLDGDRVALLIFAGETYLKTPLTLDYFHFDKVLEKVKTNDVSAGGTLMGDAIRMVMEKLFQDKDVQFRDIILITDGEDHKSFPLEAAKAAKEKRIRIHTVGIGDPAGAVIPIRNERGLKEYLTYQGETVRTRLDENTLREIADITGGIYIPVQTKRANLGDLYNRYIKNGEKREFEEKETYRWSEWYAPFLWVAVILLIIESLAGMIWERKKSL
jgi:Ca-activated chloride channel family protein